MYAVIATGGKQERVEVGQRIDVELLDAAVGEEVSFTTVMVVDGASVIAEPEPLGATSVAGRVVGGSAGPKITGFTYKSKTRSRRRYGHRQKYTTVEIVSIDSGERKVVAEVAEPEVVDEIDTDVTDADVTEAEEAQDEAAESEVAGTEVAESASEDEA